MRARDRGHVFVVHGKLESVVHDAAVVPTDDEMDVQPYWFPLLGTSDMEALTPARLATRGFGRAADGRAIWFVSVGADWGLPAHELVERAAGAVEDAIASGLPTHRNRVKPLIAMPVVGIQGGGHDFHRGSVVEELLERLEEVVAEGDADVAVVTPDASVYAAAQHIRSRSATAPADAGRLAQLARSGELALFLGAGVSVPAGLPTWQELIEMLVEGSGLTAADLEGLSALDQAELLERRSSHVGPRVTDIVQRQRRPSLAHALLAGLQAREVVTTNYDKLYEAASAATGRPTTTVLPWEAATASAPWILKMHGDVGRPDRIVLTRRHFVRYDATTRPSGSLLQSLLMTRHLLLVGASLKDDNVVRLAHEVQAFREDHDIEGQVGTLLDVDGDSARQALWSRELQWVTLSGETLVARARQLEIFLDHVARMASDDASWLLDPRFEDLLSDEERRLAEQARRLSLSLAGRGGAWERLSEALRSSGAPGGGQ